MDGAAGSPRLNHERHGAVALGTPCCNCASPLQGRWCHCCGQSTQDFHRSVWHLASEAFESFFHADGRLWRTLGRLIRNPSGLTRDFLAGRRAPQIPPLRLFLVVLLVLFLVGGHTGNNFDLLHFDHAPEDVQKQVQQSELHLGLAPWLDARLTNWMHAHLGRAMAHPDALASAMRDRAENFAFLMLPLSALLLSIIFVFRRRFFLFDHLVFSMHSLSFQGMLIVVVMLVEQPLGGAAKLLLWVAPVHLFAHMRGVYGTGKFGTLVRMAVLFVASSVVFALLLVGLVIAGLSVLHD